MAKRSSYSFFLAGFVLAVGLPTEAWGGEPTAANKVRADALFREGKELLSAGQTREACMKFEASQDLDPAVGTLLNLGECYSRLQRLVAAYEVWGEAAELARQKGDQERALVAIRRQAELDEYVPTLLLVPPDAPIEGLEVKVDGKVLPLKALGKPVPIEKGKHTVDAKAPGRTSFHKDLWIPEPTRFVLNLPSLGQWPVQVEGPVEQIDLVSDEALRARWAPWRNAGVIAGAVGLVVTGVGIGYGVAAMRTWDEANKLCWAPGSCETLDGFGVSRRAGTYADLSTGLIVPGAIVTAAGLVTFLVTQSAMSGSIESSPNQTRNSAQVVPVVGRGFGGLSMKVEF